MKIRYIPALDGLRAVAVLAVLLVHFAGVQGGWIGVQIFFVLSGYLISSNLLRDRELAGSLGEYLKIFYWRRILRIFPVYYLYVMVFIFLGIIVNYPRIYDLILPLVTYTTNIYAMLPGHASLANIGHFWSLAVEEQFYLVWPVLIFFAPIRLFRLIVVGIVAIVPLLRLYVFGYGEAFAGSVYAGELVNIVTLFQMDAFAVGALIAILPSDAVINPRRLFWIALFLLSVSGAVNLISLFSMTNLGYSAASLSTTLGYPHLMLYNLQYMWGYSLINIVCGLLIWCIVHASNPLPFLNAKSMLYLGRRSYGIYVYHVPVLLFFKTLFPCQFLSVQGIIVFVLSIVGTILVSHLSYEYFEKRLLNLKQIVVFRSAAQGA